MESHLLQMRGLKRPDRYRMRRMRIVASFTDAWIETIPYDRQSYWEESSRIFYRCVD